MKLTGAQILIRELIRNDVRTIFGYPGGAVIDIFDELYKASDEIEIIQTAHEQGASHAADGFARATGKTGVVLATSGPGATNLVTGIATAYLDSVPMVAITGNVGSAQLGKDSFQEVDIIGVTLPIVKHSYIVRDVCDLEEVITEAFHIAQEGRKGPVLIDIPKSTQNELCDYRGDTVVRRRKVNKEYDFFDAENAIVEAKKPLIYVGGGALVSEVGDEVLELSKRLNAPVTTSLMGLSAVPGSYELNLGCKGMHGKIAANRATEEADLIIGVGVRFSDRATGNVAAYTEGKKFIQIDIDEAEFDKNVPNVIKLSGNAKEILEGLLERIDTMEEREWTAKLVDTKNMEESEYNDVDFLPKNIIHKVNEWADPSVVVATDVGQHQMWVMQHYKFNQPRTILTSGGLGTMGYGMGAAIGASIARNKAPTILFTGDGSFAMNLNEVITAVKEKLPLLIVVLNNNTLGMVRQWQTLFYDKRYSSTDLADKQIDYVMMAEAFGAKGARVTDMGELDKVLSEYDFDGPMIVECMIDIDELVLPMIPAGGSAKDMISN